MSRCPPLSLSEARRRPAGYSVSTASHAGSGAIDAEQVNQDAMSDVLIRYGLGTGIQSKDRSR